MAEDGGVTLFTIGHSNRSLVAFQALLAAHAIDVVADVRSYPGSRRHPQFDRLQLERELPLGGVGYQWVGDGLGGMRDYEAHMQTDSFKSALASLLDTARTQRVACMCAEKLPEGCHRLRMSDAAVAAGASVVHIIDKDTLREHRPGGAPPADRQGSFF